MWLVALVSSLAFGQSVLLTPTNHGATVPLTVPGESVVVDLSDPRLDLDRLTVDAPARTVTFGEVYDELVTAGAEVGDLLEIAIGDAGDLQASFQKILQCGPLYKWKCTGVGAGQRCGWVDVGVRCCDRGAGPAPVAAYCVDIILRS